MLMIHLVGCGNQKRVKENDMELKLERKPQKHRAIVIDSLLNSIEYEIKEEGKAEDILELIIDIRNTADRTIEELLKINSELAADNNNITKARRKIMELEIRNGRLERERDKYKYKLIHRDEHFKEIIKESILELIEERLRR